MSLSRDGIASVSGGSMLQSGHGGLLAMTSTRTEPAVARALSGRTRTCAGTRVKMSPNQSVDPVDTGHDFAEKWSATNVRVSVAWTQHGQR